MNKEVIACDVDEVLFPLLENFLYDHNQANGTNITPADFKDYHFHGPLGLTVPETVEKVYDYLRQDHSHIKPLEGVEDALERLSSHYELEIVTARHPDFEAQTWKWLQGILPERFRAIKLIGYAPVQSERVTKAEVCTNIGAVALIDDSIEHVLKCAEVGIEGVLFGDYAWNQIDELPSGVVRCKDWQAVADHFNV